MIDKKMKTTLVGALALTLALSGSALQVAAADQETTVPVSYSNTKDIPDPDNPDNPTFAVRVPSKIVFTDVNRTIDASVEYVEQAGGVQQGITVNVAVKSANGYKLQGGGEEFPYTLTYMDKPTLSGKDSYTEIWSFDKASVATNPKKAGTAEFNQTVTKIGSYTDTLTYKVSTTP
ncbi:MAG: hypothetical protein PUB98_05465 [Clostridiales bacterium]|nr:hypothetical protein [Clostridiales bacterium]